MFSNKTDLDRHTKEIFNRLSTDAERDTKCFSIAKQYYKVKEYDTALKYVNRYINNVRSTAAAQKLLGECYQMLHKAPAALSAYKTSLELDGGQRDLVEKVCSLLCEPEVPLVASQLAYWLDRLQGLFPQHPLVFKLKEKLMQADSGGKKDPKEMESLYLSEIMARPDDVLVRIRFLDFLLATNRAKAAQDQAVELLANGVFTQHLPWYECLHRIFEAYEKDQMAPLTMQHQLRKLTVLERRSYLNLQDCGSEKRSNSDCELSIYNFDQVLQLVGKLEVEPSESQFFASALNFFRLQLVYHMAILKLRRAKSEPGEWQRAVRIANPLLMLATKSSNVKVGMERVAARWPHQDAERVAVAAHVLLAQARGRGDKYITEINEACGGKWRERTYEKIFYNKEHQLALATSCFINQPQFLEIPSALPSTEEIEKCDFDAQQCFSDNLHYLIWLGLGNMAADGTMQASFRAQASCTLPLTSSMSTVSQLDVDAFLYAAVFSCKSQPRTCYVNDAPAMLPPSIADSLATEQQSDWWATMHRTSICRSAPTGGNNSEMRMRLRKGVETIRACGSHGLHPQLLVLLAKQFQLRVTVTEDEQLKKALEQRAELYWKVAIPLLERKEKNQLIRDVSVKIFNFNGDDFKSEAIQKALEEGKLFLAIQLMKEEKYEEAVESLQTLKSPYATYYQAVIFKKLSEAATAPQYVILLTRARDALRLSEDRLRRPGIDPSHPLFTLIQDLSDDVDSLLARSSTNGVGGDNNTRNSLHTGNMSLDLTTEKWFLNEASPKPSVQTSLHTQSTPRSTRTQLFQNNTPSQPSEVEKLTSQIGELMTSKTEMSNEVGLLRTDLQDVKSILGDLLGEFKKLSVKLAERPSASDDLFGFPDADDYAEDAVYGNIQQQSSAKARCPLIPQVPLHAAPFGPELMPLYPNFMWNGGLPFGDGPIQQFQAPAIMPAGPFVPNFTAPKHIPNVVVTSSETLPLSAAPSHAPIMSVTIPLEHVRQTAKPGDGAHAFQIAMPPGATAVSPAVVQSPSDQHEARMYSQPKTVQFRDTAQVAQSPNSIFKPSTLPNTPPAGEQKTQTHQKSPLLQTPTLNSSHNSSNNGSVSEPEYDPRPDFQPIVSLPEVEVHTGEEGETQLFQSNAKLYVHKNNQWKERGQGIIKILHDEKTNKVRVLMRRDQVHKICANHHILPEMNLLPRKDIANCFIWAASDFADEAVVQETFFIKFKTLDEAKDFEYAFNRGRDIAKEAQNKTPVKSTSVSAGEMPKTLFDSPKPFSFTTNNVPLAAEPAKPAKDALMDENKPVFGSSSKLDFTALAKNASQTDAFKPSADFKGFAGVGTTLFGSKVPPANTPDKGGDKSVNTSMEDKVEEYEPNVDFKPVIPLPELVTVTTGEEDETILFEERSKILRWASETKEWKEKGLGNVKILTNPQSGRVRLVMRREQVHKVCCNHHIDETITFERITSSPKAATWTTQDFSDGEAKLEILCIRFGRVETLDAFLKTISDLQKKMKDGRIGNVSGPTLGNKPELKPLSEMFKKPANTWECSTCLVRNNNDANKCVSCETPRPGTQALKPLSEMFKKAPGSWECPGCLVQNSTDVVKCKCCETLKPGAVDESSKSVKPSQGFSFGVTPAKTASPGFTFGMPAATSNSTGFTFGVNSPATTASSAVSMSFGVNTTPASNASNFTFGAKPAASAAATIASNFTFGGKATPTTATATASNFTFGANATSTAATSPAGYMFGSKSGINTTAASTIVPFGAKPGSNTTTTSSPGFSFRAMSSSAQNTSATSTLQPAPSFSVGTPTKPVNGFPFGGNDVKLGASDKFTFTLKSPDVSASQPKSPADADKSDYDAEDLEREDENIKFKPIIPLPEKIKVQTGEEDEDVVYCHRAKLYRFVGGEWKERGLGDFKILRHKENGKIRFLMRREQVFKICLNHYLMKDMELLPKDERSWLWSAADFSEGTVVQERFCLKFRDSEIANAFKEAVDKELDNLTDSPQSIVNSPEQPKGSGSAARSLFTDDEPQTVYEYKATAEQQAQARKLQLPDNWFKYESCPPCTGCVGCDKDDGNDNNMSSLKKIESRKFEVTMVKASEETRGGSGKNETATSSLEITRGAEEKKANDVTARPANVAAKTDDPSSQKTSTPVIKFGQLPKPSETIFGASNISQVVQKVEEPRPDPATPKSSLFSNFSFKTAMESPKPEGTPVFGSAAGNIFGASKTTELSKTKFDTNNAKPSTPIFGSAVFGAQANKDSSKSTFFGNASGSIFGGSPSLETNQPAFNAPDGFSFASLASSTTGQFQSKATPGWNTEIKPIFGNSGKNAEDGGSDDERAEDETEHDPQFAPIIDLPDAIEVKSGEEDEVKLFCERGKLYRYDSKSKEWKERGIGEMKVLHNAEQGSYRLLMRREQVHKLVCNMRITAETEIQPMPKTVNSWVWAGQNYADEEGPENLAVRFKTSEQADNFKATVDKCVLTLRERSTVSEHSYFSLAPNTTAGSEAVTDANDEDDDDDEDECEGEYDEEDDSVESLVLSKEGVTLSYIIDGAENSIVPDLSLQVFEGSPDGPYRLLLQDTDCHSHSMIDPSNNVFAYKLPPTGMVWISQDWAHESEDIVTIKIDMPSADDAQHLYDTVKAETLTDEIRDSLMLSSS